MLALLTSSFAMVCRSSSLLLRLLFFDPHGLLKQVVFWHSVDVEYVHCVAIFLKCDLITVTLDTSDFMFNALCQSLFTSMVIVCQ